MWLKSANINFTKKEDHPIPASINNIPVSYGERGNIWVPNWMQSCAGELTYVCRTEK